MVLKKKKRFFVQILINTLLLIFLGVLWLIVQFPHSVRLKIGRGLGNFAYSLLPFVRKITQVNISLCFSYLPQERRILLTKKSFQSLGMGVIEAGMAWFLPKKRLQGLFRIEGLPYLEEALKQNKGVLLLGLHLTTMELAGKLATFSFPLNAVYQKTRNSLLDRFILNRRKEYYCQVIPHSNMRKVLKCLENKEIVWFAPDQDPSHKHRVFTNFFNQNTASSTTTSILAKYSHAPVLPVAYYRNKDYSGYRIIIFPALENFPSQDDTLDALKINQIFEKIIKKQPEQYLWQYKRFRNTITGRVYLYD